jgi:hypothetical protein
MRKAPKEVQDEIDRKLDAYCEWWKAQVLELMGSKPISKPKAMRKPGKAPGKPRRKAKPKATPRP